MIPATINMKKTILSIALLFTTLLMFGQSKAIPYGSNPAAGKYYNINGIKMYCEVYGNGTPVLMIHGNGGSLEAFKKNIPYFAKNYKVIAVDGRAHGKSTDNGEALTFEMMADDFSALLDAMQIKKAYVIGWSDGGINALLMAMRHPDKVIKLASTGANIWPGPTGLMPSAWSDMEKQYNAQKAQIRTTAKQKNDWKIFLLDYFQPNIPLFALRTIKCPSLMICGDHDVIPVEHTVQIFKNIPKANLWVVPNSGHPTLIEHSEDFNRAVDEFFRRKE